MAGGGKELGYDGDLGIGMKRTWDEDLLEGGRRCVYCAHLMMPELCCCSRVLISFG